VIPGFEGLPLATIIHLAIALPLCGHILLNKQSEAVALGWIAVVLFSPFLGSGLYWLFGVNRIARTARKLRDGERFPPMPQIKEASTPDREPAGEQEREIFQFAQSIHTAPFVPNNSVEPLVNGDAAYPAMLEAINSARSSIALSVYIFDRDEIGLKFINALVDAHRRGVSVYVLVDDIGLRYTSPPADKDLKRSGVATARFIPRRLKYLPYLNLRNHRKLLMVDSAVAFTGGMNIRARNMLSANPKHAVQDIHFRVTGPVISQLNQLFEEDWHFATGTEIRLPPVPDNTPAQGQVLARLIPDGPDDYFEKLQWVILGALAFARKSVRIMSPYFLPNDVISSALMVAALRGVCVEVIVPKKLDIPFISWAMTAKFERLLEHGVKIFRSPPPFDHSKIVVVDGIWSLVGSTNWDQRSLRLNFEANLECYDDAFGAVMDSYFEERKSMSQPVHLQTLQKMHLAARLRNAVVKLFSPYL